MAWSSQFQWRGLTGEVRVECVANDDPDGYTVWASDAYGYPVCTATVRYPRRGYDAMFGWVQLVRSTDNSSHGEDFEPDPFGLFGDAPSPYCWYGTEPTLFDAPSRTERKPLAWLAHSFLATTPVDEILNGNPRRVVPLLGFGWGFDIGSGSVELREVVPLTESDWKNVVPVLRAAYPAPYWTFAESI